MIRSYETEFKSPRYSCFVNIIEIYKGLAKNENRLYALFASANLYALASRGRSLESETFLFTILDNRRMPFGSVPKMRQR